MPCEKHAGFQHLSVSKEGNLRNNMKSTIRRKLERTGYFRRIYVHFVWFKNRVPKVELWVRLVSLVCKSNELGRWK